MQGALSPRRLGEGGDWLYRSHDGLAVGQPRFGHLTILDCHLCRNISISIFVSDRSAVKGRAEVAPGPIHAWARQRMINDLWSLGVMSKR
jgi:hypothetical protein